MPKTAPVELVNRSTIEVFFPFDKEIQLSFLSRAALYEADPHRDNFVLVTPFEEVQEVLLRANIF